MQGGITDKVAITSGVTHAFNFSTFRQVRSNNAQSAMMCVDPQDGDLYSLSCVEVGFEVTVSPATVPSNFGQLVTVSYSGSSVASGDVIMFAHPSFTCDYAFLTAHDNNPGAYSSSQKVTSADSILTFDFAGMSTSTNVEAVLCVNDTSTGSVYRLPGATITVTKPVVGISGDPHVRTPSGAWLDFYGESDVYELLDGSSGIQANAKFGYAVRDNFMIWHPKVMRPGTLMEEVGITLKDTQTSLRLGIQGGGIVSVRHGPKATEFWASAEERSLQVGDYTLSWAKCTQNCDVVMPWGTHQRSHSLTVQGQGEFLQLWVAKSGGYRFIDAEAMPAAGATGLLADAAIAPAALAQRLLTGGEVAYKASVAMLS